MPVNFLGYSAFWERLEMGFAFELNIGYRKVGRVRDLCV